MELCTGSFVGGPGTKLLGADTTVFVVVCTLEAWMCSIFGGPAANDLVAAATGLAKGTLAALADGIVGTALTAKLGQKDVVGTEARGMM